MLDIETLKSISNGRDVKICVDKNQTSSFDCPKCGSSHFGSTGWGTANPTYYCHDEFERGCSWSGSKEECFSYTYSKQMLAQSLLAAYQEISDLKRHLDAANLGWI